MGNYTNALIRYKYDDRKLKAALLQIIDTMNVIATYADNVHFTYTRATFFISLCIHLERKYGMFRYVYNPNVTVCLTLKKKCLLYRYHQQLLVIINIIIHLYRNAKIGTAIIYLSRFVFNS